MRFLPPEVERKASLRVEREGLPPEVGGSSLSLVEREAPEDQRALPGEEVPSFQGDVLSTEEGTQRLDQLFGLLGLQSENSLKGCFPQLVIRASDGRRQRFWRSISQDLTDYELGTHPLVVPDKKKEKKGGSGCHIQVRPKDQGKKRESPEATQILRDELREIEITREQETRLAYTSDQMQRILLVLSRHGRSALLAGFAALMARRSKGEKEDMLSLLGVGPDFRRLVIEEDESKELRGQPTVTVRKRASLFSPEATAGTVDVEESRSTIKEAKLAAQSKQASREGKEAIRGSQRLDSTFLRRVPMKLSDLAASTKGELYCDKERLDTRVAYQGKSSRFDGKGKGRVYAPIVDTVWRDVEGAEIRGLKKGLQMVLSLSGADRLRSRFTKYSTRYPSQYLTPALDLIVVDQQPLIGAEAERVSAMCERVEIYCHKEEDMKWTVNDLVELSLRVREFPAFLLYQGSGYEGDTLESRLSTLRHFPLLAESSHADGLEGSFALVREDPSLAHGALTDSLVVAKQRAYVSGLPEVVPIGFTLAVAFDPLLGGEIKSVEGPIGKRKEGSERTGFVCSVRTCSFGTLCHEGVSKVQTCRELCFRFQKMKYFLNPTPVTLLSEKGNFIYADVPSEYYLLSDSKIRSRVVSGADAADVIFDLRAGKSWNLRSLRDEELLKDLLGKAGVTYEDREQVLYLPEYGRELLKEAKLVNLSTQLEIDIRMSEQCFQRETHMDNVREFLKRREAYWPLYADEERRKLCRPSVDLFTKDSKSAPYISAGGSTSAQKSSRRKNCSRQRSCRLVQS